MASKATRGLEAEKETLANDDIDERDRERIQDLVEREEGNKAPGTVLSHSKYCRLTSRRSGVPLVEATLDDLTALLRDLRDGVHPSVKDDGIIIKNYESALRVFYRANDDLGVTPGEIEVDEDYHGRELGASDLLYVDDVDPLLAAAKRTSLCYSALIALMLATGQRIDVARTIRVKHVERDGPAMAVKVNSEEADTKGATGKRSLLWAKHYVREWYEAHPYTDDPEAALFPARALGDRYHPDRRYAKEPMAQHTVRKLIRQSAQEAGIEKDVYPHLLRHTALTRMVSEGLSEQQIKKIAGWHGDSSQFDTYVHLSEDLETDSVRESLGYPTSDSGAPIVGRPSLDTCPNCGDRIPDGEERCLTCNSPLTHRESQREAPSRDPTDEKIREGYREAKDMDTVEKVQLLDDLLDDPEVRTLLQDRMD